MRKWSFLLTVSLLLVGLARHDSRATTLLRVELEGLSLRADRVVRGHVALDHVEVDELTGVIVRIWKLEPEEVIAGDAPEGPIEVVTLGGRMGPIGQVVEDAAVLEDGQEVALFLAERPDGRNRVVTMAQGVFRVLREEPSAQVERDGGLDVWDRDGGGYVRLETLRLSLDEFRQKVRAARGEP